MLDYVAIFQSGGLILFEKAFLSGSEALKIRSLVSEFIREVFLSQKIQKEKKIILKKSVFEYKLNKKLGVVTLIVYPQIFANSSFSGFLAYFAEIFEKRYIKGLSGVKKDLFEILKFQKKILEDFLVLLKTTEFTESKSNPVNKWEIKKKRKRTPKKEQENKRTWDPAFLSNKAISKNVEKLLNLSKTENLEN